MTVLQIAQFLIAMDTPAISRGLSQGLDTWRRHPEKYLPSILVDRLLAYADCTPEAGLARRVRGPDMHVTLETADGRYVLSTTLPPFNELPSVLLWGDRVFILPVLLPSEGQGPPVSGSRPLVYREAFFYVVTTR